MRYPLGFVAALLVICAVPAHAERDPRSGAPIRPDDKREIPSPITDHFYIRGTLFSAHAQTELRVDARDGTPGTLVSGESDLGLPSHRLQGRVEFMFRLRERNRLRVDYYELDRSGSQQLTRTIHFGDQTFSPNDLVSSSVDWRSFGLTYTYSVIRRDYLEVGVGLAVHALQAQANASANHNGQLLHQAVSGAAPFPGIPIDVTWRMSRHFAFVAWGQYYRASLSGFDGSLAEYHGDFQYRWRPNFALGVGYTLMKTVLDVQEAEFPGLFRLDVRGPEAFFRVSF
jgi:hypothetical protein